MEKAYFGMDYLRVTYGPHGNKSHKNSWAIDLGGKDTGVDPFYAPFTGIVRRLRSNSNELWFESSEPVQWADGTQDYATIMLIHAYNVPVSSGQTVPQGALLYYEGAKGNANGNHIHFEVGKGKFVSPYGWYDNGNGDDGSEVWNIYNQVDPTRVFFLKPTCTILDVGTDNTSGAALHWVTDDGTATGNLEANSYFTVGVGNMEYFSATDVYSNLGYLEKGKTYLAYDSYVGSDYTWWRFRHPNGNLYWTAMLWDKCSAYGTISETAYSDKTLLINGDVQLYNAPDPFNLADIKVSNEDRIPLKSKLDMTLYDKEWFNVSYNGKTYYIPNSDSVSIVDASWEDCMAPLPAGSSIKTIVDDVWYYSSPDPGDWVAQLAINTTLIATRQSSTGIKNYNWYEVLLQDGSLAYIVVNDTQVTLTKGTEGGVVVPPSGGGDYSTNVYGIDVSKYQGSIDWNLVKGDPQNIKFAFIRAVSTRDANAPYVDEYLIRNMQGAQAAGIPYGIYIFTYGDNESEIDAEVDLAISQIKGYNLTYPVAWDFEADNFKSTSKKASNTNLILYALRRIQNYGYLPILYTYYNMIMNYVDWKLILDNGFAIWIADYRGYNGFANEGGTCTIWQYSSSGSVNGISGRCDMDISYFDYERYITDVGLNDGATSQYPSVSYGGYLTINVGNAEAFPYPSVYAEGNYYLMKGASYSVIGVCEEQIEGYTWYLIRDNNLTKYVPFIADKMTLTTGSFITSQYRFQKTTKKTWLSAYANMEFFSDTDVFASMGYLTRNIPYEIFGFLIDPVNSNNTDFMFVIIKVGDAYRYCVDFSKDNKCYIYESEDPYPYDPVDTGNKLVTYEQWTGMYPYPSTYGTNPDDFLEPGKLYNLLGKTRYNFDNLSWFVIDVDGKMYYILDDGNSSVTTDQFEIPYEYTKFTNTTNLEVCATTKTYKSCDDSTAGEALETDQVYTLYGKITDSSVSGEWYVMMGSEYPLYVKVSDGNCLVYEGTPYQRTACENVWIIPNVALAYYDKPTKNENVSKAIGDIPVGTVLMPVSKINRVMVGGVWYEVKYNDLSYYVCPESVQSYVGSLDLSYDYTEPGYYLQAINSFEARAVPHSYAESFMHVPANTRIVNPIHMKVSADGNDWYAFDIGNNTYAFFMKDENFTEGYTYNVKDVGKNFYCTSSTANVVIYDHCATDPDHILAIVEAPAEVSISGEVTDFDYPKWYTTIMENGTVGYICANDNYTFDYNYTLYQLSDYAHAKVTQEATVYERPDESSPEVEKLPVGDYPVEFMAGGDGTVDGTWLMIDENKFVKTGTNVTLAYIYPSNVVSKYLVINVIGESGLTAYTLADTSSASTTIPYGTQVKPTSTFEANGNTWYAVDYNSGTYYVLMQDPNMKTENVYEQDPVIEGFSAYTDLDTAKCYEEPDTSSTAIPLTVDTYYPVMSILKDEINGNRWYSIMVEGNTYYIQIDAPGVSFSYNYESTEYEDGWYIRPLTDSYQVYDNPVEPQKSYSIPKDITIPVYEKLTTNYNGQTWYLTMYDDLLLYAPINSDGTNAELFNLQEESNLADLKSILKSVKDQRDSALKVCDDIASLEANISSLHTNVNNWASAMGTEIEALEKIISRMEEDQ